LSIAKKASRSPSAYSFLYRCLTLSILTGFMRPRSASLLFVLHSSKEVAVFSLFFTAFSNAIATHGRPICLYVTPFRQLDRSHVLHLLRGERGPSQTLLPHVDARYMASFARSQVPRNLDVVVEFSSADLAFSPLTGPRTISFSVVLLGIGQHALNAQTIKIWVHSES
jgi:hypothetical protein